MKVWCANLYCQNRVVPGRAVCRTHLWLRRAAVISFVAGIVASAWLLCGCGAEMGKALQQARQDAQRERATKQVCEAALIFTLKDLKQCKEDLDRKTPHMSVQGQGEPAR